MGKSESFSLPSAFDGRWQFFTVEEYHKILGKSIKYILERHDWDATSADLDLQFKDNLNIQAAGKAFSSFKRAQMELDTPETKAFKKLTGFTSLKVKHRVRKKRITRLYRTIRRQIRQQELRSKQAWQGIVYFSVTVKRTFL